MSNTYNIIGTPNADGTLKEFGNTSPKVESPAAVNVSFDNTGTSLQSDNAEDAIKEIDEKVGDTDISSIGDGTATGAISTINSNLKDAIKIVHDQKVEVTGDGHIAKTFYIYPSVSGYTLIGATAAAGNALYDVTLNVRGKDYISGDVIKRDMTPWTDTAEVFYNLVYIKDSLVSS